MKDNVIRDHKGRFPKGVSGNPKGSTKKAPVTEADTFRQIFQVKVPKVARELFVMAFDESIKPEIRFRCLKEILDRGMGTPRVFVDAPPQTDDTQIDPTTADADTVREMIAHLNKLSEEHDKS